MFVRDCGATTGFSSQVSIIAIDRELADEPGNAFISDAWGGASQVALKWQRPDILVIRYDSSARVFNMNARVGEVDIAYQPQPP